MSEEILKENVERLSREIPKIIARGFFLRDQLEIF